jgi:branched-chain amino acid transport system ATP-binding protein
VFENIRCAVLWSLGLPLLVLAPRGGLRRRRRSAPTNWSSGSTCAAVATRWPGVLSYAEQRALEIGVTIAGGADVILLDEPTAGMSNTETAARSL